MQLTQMKPNILSLNPTLQAELFEKYTILREQDMTMPIVQPRTKGKGKAKGKQIKLTTEQYTLLQKLGLV